MAGKEWNIRLTPEERALANGDGGPVLQKAMQTVIRYGEALGAERLVDISGPGHFVIAYAIPGIAPSMEMLEELVAAGCKTKYPFTLDPRPPLDYENWLLDGKQVALLDEMYRDQPRYEDLMLLLGLRDADSYTCRPYLEEVGNIPRKGDILAWSESACVIFANSVLGARTNKNGAIIDLLCNIVGKVPLTGLLEDAARRATWRIDVRSGDLPPPQLLGAAIGKQVLADVPFVTGLDQFLDSGVDSGTRDYLHELGAACATAGAVGLFHVENITPEALDHGRDILVPEHRSCVIDDAVIGQLAASYPVLWLDKGAPPEKCYLGCPHLSLDQIAWWADSIQAALQERQQTKIKVATTICAAPQTLKKLNKTGSVLKQLDAAGVKFSAGCPMQLFDNDLAARSAIITNSNKLRAYTNARFFPDHEMVDILVGGEI